MGPVRPIVLQLSFDPVICRTCRVPKLRSEFQVDRTLANGLRADCRSCRKAERRRVYLLNRVHELAVNARWHRQNHAKHTEMNRRWRAANRERERELIRRWGREHPELLRAYRYQRRARKLGAAGSATAEQIQARIDFYGGLCWMCREPYDELDHVKPLSRGGSNWPANLRPACLRCNRTKCDTWPLALSA
jgi:5-methylcytosine-specific restriction endonuclease McrA